MTGNTCKYHGVGDLRRVRDEPCTDRLVAKACGTDKREERTDTMGDNLGNVRDMCDMSSIENVGNVIG